MEKTLDELTIKRTIAKGARTQELIEGYKEAWAELEADLWKMWKSTKSDAIEKREEIFREYHACKALQAKLQKVVNEGKKAEEEMRQQKVKYGDRNRT